ncbi:emp24/gp25L/p24 family/GOLD-domain-containing protein [Chlamydoabsidia padenii]|nr:emp24/gp25L/p24 family/GOLD-domain-containing protein [Chlamydoabsidia padenii]
MPMTLSLVYLLVIIVTLIVSTQAVKFDLPATDQPTPRCLSQFVTKDTQVFITVSQDGSVPNVYTKKRDLQSSFANAFDTISEGQVRLCFTNTLEKGSTSSRWVEVVMNIGANAMDDKLVAKSEKLDPLELELRKLEKVVQEIVDEMVYLKIRETFMRGTNESTNERVKWFSVVSLLALVSLGFWQILYLRHYFRRKRLID